MKKHLLAALLMLGTGSMFAQNQNVGIGTTTPDASAILDLTSSSKGFLAPRVTTAERTAITSPANGLLVYDITIGCYFYYNSTGWLSLCQLSGPVGPQGPAGVNGATGANGANGAPGPTGPQGQVGAMGPQGPAGAAGVAGPQGPAGVAGPQGPQGVQGVAGPQGLQGVAGPQGSTGANGATGAQGIQGVTGNNGATGPQGVTGVNGATGAQGIQGINGNDGPTGAQGIQGLVGATGATGPQGIQGPSGINAATGSQGAPGATGDTGATGPQGIQGVQGVTGATGAQGIQGIQGIQGATGIQGIQGIQGPTGAQGIQGVTGLQGIQGPTGAQGIQGIQGPTGLQGIQGIQGITGATGNQGVQGIQGPTGLQGIQGIQGLTGSQGIQGLTGPTGPNWTITNFAFNNTGTLNITTTDPQNLTTTAGAWLTSGNSGITTSNFLGTVNAAPLIFETSNTESARILSTGEVLTGSATFIAPAIAGDKFSSFMTSNTNNWALNGINNVVQGGSLYGANISTSNEYNAIEATHYYSGNAYVPSAVFGLAISSVTTNTSIGVSGTNNGQDGVGVQGTIVDASNGLGFGGAFYNNLGYTGGAYTISDERVKRNVKTIDGALEIIEQLRGVTYDHKIDEYPHLGLGQGRQYGFIAQEIEQVMPEAVRLKNLNVNACAPVQAKTPAKADIQKFKMVNYVTVVPVLVEAIKEQQKQIEAQQKQIDELTKLIKK